MNNSLSSQPLGTWGAERVGLARQQEPCIESVPRHRRFILWWAGSVTTFRFPINQTWGIAVMSDCMRTLSVVVMWQIGHESLPDVSRVHNTPESFHTELKATRTCVSGRRNATKNTMFAK